jgi:hypothetical protein
MTNLSDLFPAGAGKQVAFTASGNVTIAGKPVILNANGTVTQVTSTAIPAAIGSAATYQSSVAFETAATFDSNSNKVVVAFQGNTNYGYGVVGTVSGTSISWGTPVVFSSTNTARYMAATFDSNSNRVVFAYQDFSNSSYGTAVVGEVSGTSISYGSATVFASENPCTEFAATFDSSNNKVIIAYRDSVNCGDVIVGTVSGTSISFGTKDEFSNQTPMYMSATFDTFTNQPVIAYNEASSPDGRAFTAAVSGTSITAATPVVFSSNNARPGKDNGIAYDSSSNKVVIAYGDTTQSDDGYAVVGTVNGTTLTFGTPVQFESGAVADYSPQVSYNVAANKHVIAYTDTSNSNYGEYVIGTVSGTSISFTSSATFESGGTNYLAITYDSNEEKTVVAFADTGNSNYGKGIAIQPAYTSTNLTATNFLGISDEAISSAASGNITIKGGIAATGLSSLTPGSDYYVQIDGTFGTSADNPSVKAGKALSATAINLEYQS